MQSENTLRLELGGQPFDFMSSDYSVSAKAGTTSGLPQRTVSVDLFDSRNVPPDGATTILTAAVTI